MLFGWELKAPVCRDFPLSFDLQIDSNQTLSPMWKFSQKQPQDFWMLNTNRRAQNVLHFFCQYHYNNNRFFIPKRYKTPNFLHKNLETPQISYSHPNPQFFQKKLEAPTDYPAPSPCQNNGWSLKFLLLTQRSLLEVATFAECVATRNKTLQVLL